MGVRAVLVASVAVSLALVACTDDGEQGGGDEATTTAGPTTSTPSTTSTTVDEEAALEATIVDAYDQSWIDFLRAANPPDPEAAYLADHTTEPNLTHSRDALRTLTAEGTLMRGTFETDPRVTELDGDTATVEDCGLDQIELVAASTGEVLESPNDDRDGWRAEMVREDGAWKVSSLKQTDEVCTEAAGG